MSQEEQTPIVDENHIIAERREKLAQLRKNGVAFPNDFVPTHHAADLHEHYGEISKEQLSRKKYHGQSSRSNDAQARDGQSQLCDCPRSHRSDSVLYQRC
jgi:lysyl-tRNA synthetase class II